MYQPVSYKLSGRMGTRADLRNLIGACRKRQQHVHPTPLHLPPSPSAVLPVCHPLHSSPHSLTIPPIPRSPHTSSVGRSDTGKVGVRVYADAVINHMTGGGILGLGMIAIARFSGLCTTCYAKSPQKRGSLSHCALPRFVCHAHRHFAAVWPNFAVFPAAGNDMAQHRREDGSTCTTWTNKSSSLAPEWGGDGTGPSPFYTQDNVFATSPVTAARSAQIQSR